MIKHSASAGSLKEASTRAIPALTNNCPAIVKKIVTKI